MSITDRFDDYDWKEVFKYGDRPTLVNGASCSTDGFDLDSVEAFLWADEGENDGANWIAVVRLKDGRFASIRAGCDYTGWG